MDEIKITSREVSNNLHGFNDHLIDMRREKRSCGKERCYEVLLNRHTGMMRFPQGIDSFDFSLSKKRESDGQSWEKVSIIVSDTPECTVHFQLEGASGLDALALRVCDETLKVLNIKGQEAHTEEAVLQALSLLPLAPQGKGIENLGCEWVGPLSREAAEKNLEGKPPGTFLVRDVDATVLFSTQALAVSNHLQAIPYILTIIEKENEISEHLILYIESRDPSFHPKQGWVLYSDEPNLKVYSAYYTSPQELVQKVFGSSPRSAQ